MRNGLIIIFISFIAVCINCSKDNPVGPIGEDPNIKMISIPRGSFLMGAEVEDKFVTSDLLYYMRPVHMVYLDGFEMSETEITQRQYKAVMQTNPSQAVGDSLPVNNVSWYDAAQFCNRLSDYYRLERCYNESSWECDFSKNGCRLPTEAEWEYACRAGTTTLYYSGDTEDELAKVGWYKQNSDLTLHPVGRKEANAWGLYDMHGNVAEWCNNWFDAYGNWVTVNPRGSASGSDKVLRGGSIASLYFGCWSAFRIMAEPASNKSRLLGFRVVRKSY